MRIKVDYNSLTDNWKNGHKSSPAWLPGVPVAWCHHIIKKKETTKVIISYGPRHCSKTAETNCVFYIIFLQRFYLFTEFSYLCLPGSLCFSRLLLILPGRKWLIGCCCHSMLHLISVVKHWSVSCSLRNQRWNFLTKFGCFVLSFRFPRLWKSPLLKFVGVMTCMTVP